MSCLWFASCDVRENPRKINKAHLKIGISQTCPSLLPSFSRSFWPKYAGLENGSSHPGLEMVPFFWAHVIFLFRGFTATFGGLSS